MVGWVYICEESTLMHTYAKTENIFTDLGHVTTNRMLCLNMHVYGERGGERDI